MLRRRRAKVVELVDTLVSEASAQKAWGFKSPPSHQAFSPRKLSPVSRIVKQRLRCTKCKHEFVSDGPSECENCGHVYVVWVDYDPKKFGN